MKTKIKLVMALFAIMLVGVTSVFAYSVGDLCNAAADGNINKVKTIVNSGVDVNGRAGDKGNTALIRAVQSNKPTIMKYLISKGASVDRKNTAGNAPIHSAAYRGYLEAVKILIYNGADPNIKGSDGLTALGNAQQEGHTKVIQFLKEHGAQ